MARVMAPDAIPLVAAADGVARIRGSRVTLDTVMVAFNEGAAAEQIASQYPSLDLADVSSVIGHDLRRRPEVEANLAERRRAAMAVRQQNEARFRPRGVRDRLVARCCDALA